MPAVHPDLQPPTGWFAHFREFLEEFRRLRHETKDQQLRRFLGKAEPWLLAQGITFDGRSIRDIFRECGDDEHRQMARYEALVSLCTAALHARGLPLPDGISPPEPKKLKLKPHRYANNPLWGSI